MRNSHKEHSLSTNQFYSDYGINTADKLMSNRKTRIPNVPSRRTDKYTEENSAENNSLHGENPGGTRPQRNKDGVVSSSSRHRSLPQGLR